ncbi:cell division protein FtsQ/DivIB [Thalassotalea sediminis]|uniref:cell division protein FtsQ/DivIB n=1 Tax=Thalassotalea sediminis TaxID=1759089 RepID=UPI0025722BC7|nr:cell division protein FtsQ/DivIB [Thalassotalea sediminis]
MNVTVTKQNKSPNKAQNQQLHWSFWFGVGFFVLVILSLCYLGWLMSERLTAQETAPVTSVVINGEMPYTTRADIEKAIESVNLGNFFQVDVNKVQRQVSDLPWVFSASVRKQWPNELKIYVVDQQPVAFWNGDFLINAQGVAFQADTSRVEKALPAFYGPEGSEQTALENYTNLSDILAYGKLSIDELMLSERYSWQLTLNDGVSLNLGREDRVQRIQRFIDVYPQIKKTAKAKQQIDYVDLRYDTGLAVGWKPLTEKERV